MNNIIIDKNILTNYSDNFIEIKDNKLTFKVSGNYTLEYVDSDLIDLEIEVLDDVIVNLFIFSNNDCLKVSNCYQISKNANLVVYKFYYNNIVTEDIIVNLNGEKSLFSYNFSSISNGSDEYHIVVNHNNSRVGSKISNKCIGLDGSKIKIQIDSILDKGNIDCVMDQDSRVLTLGDVDATIIPNMFIEEDSVEARHGSVIGKIRDEDIFYLMSRGISEEESITLLIKGFIFSNLMVDMDKRARIFQILQNLRR